MPQYKFATMFMAGFIALTNEGWVVIVLLIVLMMFGVFMSARVTQFIITYISDLHAEERKTYFETTNEVLRDLKDAIRENRGDTIIHGNTGSLNQGDRFDARSESGSITQAQAIDRAPRYDD